MAKSKYILTHRRPASWWRNAWREALVCGNSKMGASVYGGAGEETIMITHGDLWCGQIRGELPDVSHTLKETRRLMDAKQYREASWVLTNAVKEQGYISKLGFPLPVCDLLVNMPVRSMFRHYRRMLDMRSAEIKVSWEDDGKKYTRSTFMSRADDLLAMEIACDGGLVEAQIGLQLHNPEHLTRDKKGRPYTDMLLSGASITVDGNFVYYHNINQDGKYFGGVAGVFHADELQGAEPESRGADAAEAKLREKEQFVKAKGEKLLVLCKFFIKSEDPQAEYKALRAQVEETAAQYDYAELLSRHRALHEPLMTCADVNLIDEEDDRTVSELLDEAYDEVTPNALTEKLWAFGRYLFICGTSAENNPFPLYGLWCGDYDPAWPHNMANENTQCIYWHATVGGLSDYVRSLIKYYNSLIEDFRTNARKMYGCRGILMPAGTTPGLGAPNQIVPVIMNWISCAGWISRHFVDYYRFTGDEKCLREEILPFLYEIFLFYRDFLVKEANGQYKLYPSVSPENTPKNYYIPNTPHPMPTTINSTMDVAVAKELLHNFARYAQLMGEYPEEAAQAAEMAEHLPEYRFNEDKSIREWIPDEFDDNYQHRHISHIYPIFPGDEVERTGSAELFEGCRIAVEKRLALGLSSQTGWSFSHLASIFARLKEGDRLMDCIDQISKACLTGGLLSTHNDWRGMGTSFKMSSAPVQLDCSLGMVNAIQEAIVFVGDGQLELLPALPSRWNKGNARALCFPGGKLDIDWDMEKASLKAVLTFDRAVSVKIAVPEYIASKLNLTLNGAAMERVITVNASAGETITIAG